MVLLFRAVGMSVTLGFRGDKQSQIDHNSNLQYVEMFALGTMKVT